MKPDIGVGLHLKYYLKNPQLIGMTTFGLAEMEALGLLEKKHKTSVRVTNTITNHPDMLTDKELEVLISFLPPNTQSLL